MIFAFGRYELDEERFELRRDRRVVSLQPKALMLLLCLVRNSPRVVSKEELLGSVWPDAVVTDGSLARAVSLARAAIRDHGGDRPAIATVPRRGYQFHWPVRTVKPAAAKPGPARVPRDPASNYVGRAELLARLSAVLDAALAGAGRMVFLAGEAGIGKTRTAELLAERARAAGAQVATGWGVQDSAVPTYWSWTRIFRSLAAEAGPDLAELLAGDTAELARLVPEFGVTKAPGESGLRPAAGAGTGQSARYRLFDAAQAFLARAAQRRPLALFFDDLHWADAESIWLLEFVGHEVGSLPIAIVATCREDETGHSAQRARALERLLRLTTLERWALSGLMGVELRDFVRLRTGVEPNDSLAEALERKTGGNPLFLEESVRSLASRDLLTGQRDPSAWEALLPQGIQHLVRHKLRHLSPHAIEVLCCAAAMGAELDRNVLRQSIADTIDLERGLREAEEAGLLFSHGPAAPRIRFSHVLVREALYAELVPAGLVRRRFHARLANALEISADTSDEGLAERALHACEAAPLVDPHRASLLAQAVASRAARFHDFESAAAWYQRALDVTESNPTTESELRVELLLGLAEAKARATGLELARPSYRRAAELARSSGRGDFFALAALGYASRPSATGQGDPVVVHLLEEAARMAPPSDQALSLRVQSRLAAELRYTEPARAEALMEQTVAAARRVGQPAALAQVLDDCSFVRWSSADPEGWIALNVEVSRNAHNAGDLELALHGEKGRIAGLLEIGDFVAVHDVIETCEKIARVLRTPYARWLVTSLHGMCALMDGRLDDAQRQVAESFPLGEQADSPEVALELQGQLLYLRLEQGRVAEVEAPARSLVERFPGVPAFRAALGRILMAEGRLLEARHELERLAEAGFSGVPRDRGWLPMLALAAEITHATGATARAELLEELLARYDRLCVVAGSGLLFYGSVSHHLGLLAASQSRWDAAIGRFETAERVHERAGARIWLARTAVASARALLGRGRPEDRRRAAEKVATVHQTARALGLAQIEADARELDRRLRGRSAAASA